MIVVRSNGGESNWRTRNEPGYNKVSQWAGLENLTDEEFELSESLPFNLLPKGKESFDGEINGLLIETRIRSIQSGAFQRNLDAFLAEEYPWKGLQ